MIEKKIEGSTISKLEKSKKEVLKRIAETLKDQEGKQDLQARHTSHSSGSGRTHSSVVTN